MVFLNSLLLALAAHASSGQDSSRHVNYTTVTVSMSKALADLSRLSGMEIHASPPVASEPIILRLDDVPIDAALKQIATTFEAQWERKKTGLVLTRPEELVRKTQAELDAKAAIVIAAELAKKTKVIADMPAWDSAFANRLANQFGEMMKELEGEGVWTPQVGERHAAIRAKLPTSRALARLMGLLDPKALASIRPGERIVFSSDPTPLQLPLPHDLSGVLDPYTAETAVWIEERKRVLPDYGKTGGSFHDGSDGLDQPSKPSTVLVTATRATDGGLDFGLIIANATGHIVGQSQDSIGTFDYEAYRKQLDTRSPDPVIKLSSESEAIRQALIGYQNFDGNRPMKRLDPAIHQILVHPEQREPLSFAASEILNQIRATIYLAHTLSVGAPTLQFG